MKTMCSPGYHHNGFVATPALGHKMYYKYELVLTPTECSMFYGANVTG